MTRRALLVDAFTQEPFAGNAAGVVPDADDLSDSQMQAIASELGASETAFVRASDAADRRLRYFTPTEEVDLCGHATIATHAFLADDIGEGTHTLETNVGVLDIELDGETVWMRQNAPEVAKVDATHAEVAETLGIRETGLSGLGADLPLARASTGLPFLMVPVEYLSDLSKMSPDMAAIETLAADHDCRGVYAFTFDTLEAESTLHGRCFVPGAGVPEDPVTGTASGACGAYLDRFGAFDPTPEEMLFEQGHFLDRDGLVRVDASAATTEGRVRVGGTAVTALDGEIRLPVDDDDEILEA
ncbi:PhzF family phenazine biosynthesis isomerase [Halosegnis rubeus]|jgi:PhzF family phenazine biosynthesis protein|uniref:PhzF family phenazine biosynthesis isomerase n=1 Tax=Halosegnis rubeus TaxID=2212850 RepID=A0A5N5U8G1_9EURY|nr:PhzF family phenazine biosynthesis protein [Halosegnis rubeus]KAB7514807.1 PhzF family phenazine biosynthesis isomerase [Halosegnis rubeus]KAB7518119.1 PhzF family phenazine biosynthesis isomerase [Halosegnis rubeus]